MIFAWLKEQEARRSQEARRERRWRTVRMAFLALSLMCGIELQSLGVGVIVLIVLADGDGSHYRTMVTRKQDGRLQVCG